MVTDDFKAAVFFKCYNDRLKLHLLLFFILTRDKMIMCNVKDVACSDKPT